MQIKITEEDIINHNKHILAVSGGNFGIIDKSTLDFAIDSVNNETSTINQASNFLYYVSVGHPFSNGNKRTAFEVAKGIMASGALILNPPEEKIVGFVTGSIAQGKATREEVKKWLELYSSSINKEFDFNQITKENIEKDKLLLKKLD